MILMHQTLSTYLVFAAAAAAAALSAFEVPGLLDAELRLPKRFVGLGAMMLAFGRETVGIALFSWPGSCGRLEDPLALTVLGFKAFLAPDGTTTFFAAG